MSIDVPIKAWALEHGYVSWKRKQGEALRLDLRGDRVRIRFLGEDIGERCIEWRYGRVRVGKKFTMQVPDSAKQFRLAVPAPGILSISPVDE